MDIEATAILGLVIVGLLLLLWYMHAQRAIEVKGWSDLLRAVTLQKYGKTEQRPQPPSNDEAWSAHNRADRMQKIVSDFAVSEFHAKEQLDLHRRALDVAVVFVDHIKDAIGWKDMNQPIENWFQSTPIRPIGFGIGNEVWNLNDLVKDFDAWVKERKDPATWDKSEKDQLRDQLSDAHTQLTMIAEALGVAAEPHQTFRDRLLEQASSKGAELVREYAGAELRYVLPDDLHTHREGCDHRGCVAVLVRVNAEGLVTHG